MKHYGLMALLAIFFLIACQQNEQELPNQTGGKSISKERLRTIKKVDGNIETRAVAEKNKIWKAGDTIRIKFLNGSATIQEKVKLYAAEWLAYANLKFEYVNAEDNADVKIGFDLDTRFLAWSTIGTDCKAVPQNEPSLNFVWLEEEEEAFIKTEVLRSFGHILGLGFEHRNPSSPIVFNGRAQSYFENTWGLSEEDVLNDILPVYNTEYTNYTTYDKGSIMILDIPRTIVTNPADATASNTELSQADKIFIAEQYPRSVIATITTSQTSINFTVVQNSDIEVDWGDGTDTTNVFTHNYNVGGEHIITFYGSATALKEFVCELHQLTNLNIKNNHALTKLICRGNQLTGLDVSTNTALKELDCEFNKLTTLNINGNHALTKLICKENLLTSIDISTNAALKELDCEFNQLSSLNISHTGITGFNCGSNRISNLILNEKLIDLCCPDNLLTTLDVTNNTKLEVLYCPSNQLAVLDVSRQLNLRELYCMENNLENLDVSKNRYLTVIVCSNNLLASLELNNQPNLVNLYCSNNRLNGLNLSNSSNIIFVECYNNPFIDNPFKALNLANSLPDRTGKQGGIINVSNFSSPEIEAVGIMRSIADVKKWYVH